MFVNFDEKIKLACYFCYLFKQYNLNNKYNKNNKCSSFVIRYLLIHSMFFIIFYRICVSGTQLWLITM
jgi:hypothetical protein